MASISWYEVLRGAHLLAGIFAFSIAPIVLVRRKGTHSHRLLGRLYFLPMSFAAASATVLAALKDNTTFVFIGVFSFYLGLSGYRALAFKPSYITTLVDKLMAGLAALFFLAMVAFAASQFATSLARAIPLFAFGTVGTVLALADLRRLSAGRPQHSWFFGHMTGMVSSYIAAVSAFSVVNLSFLPLPVRILWPALLGIPALLLLRRAWRHRLQVAPLSSWVDLKA